MISRPHVSPRILGIIWLAVQTFATAAETSEPLRSVSPVTTSALAAPTPVPNSAALPATPVTGRPLRRIIIAENIELLQSLVLPPSPGFVVITPAFAKFDLD